MLVAIHRGCGDDELGGVAVGGGLDQQQLESVVDPALGQYAGIGERGVRERVVEHLPGGRVDGVGDRVGCRPQGQVAAVGGEPARSAAVAVREVGRAASLPVIR